MKKQAAYRFKTAAVDLSKIKALGLDVDYGEEPEELVMQTPGGHRVTMPYQEATVKHHLARLGDDPYHQQLGSALKNRGAEIDRRVQEERQHDAAMRRTGNVLGLGMVSGGLGALAGGALGGGRGATVGGILGALAGGYGGSRLKVTPKTGPENVHGEELSQLYKEPEHVKQLREMQSELEDMQYQARSRRPRYDDDDDYYYNRRHAGYYY